MIILNGWGKRMYLYYILAGLVIVVDQITKWIIDTKMDLHESIPVLGNFFSITSHRNEGAAWGILQGQMTFFYVVTAFVVVFIVYYLHKYAKNNLLLGISLSLILGGAIGNFIDRLFRQEVVDFLDVMIVNYDFPIFNIADSALVIGVGIILLLTIFEEKLMNSEGVKDE